MFITSVPGRYASMFVLAGAASAPGNLAHAWVPQSLPRPKAKRAAAMAVIHTFSSGVTHFYTSYAFPDEARPHYYGGMAMMSAACLVIIGMAIYLKFYLKKQNRLIEAAEAEGKLAPGISGSKEGHGGEGIVSFRYVH